MQKHPRISNRFLFPKILLPILLSQSYSQFMCVRLGLQNASRIWSSKGLWGIWRKWSPHAFDRQKMPIFLLFNFLLLMDSVVPLLLYFVSGISLFYNPLQGKMQSFNISKSSAKKWMEREISPMYQLKTDCAGTQIFLFFFGLISFFHTQWFLLLSSAA